MDRRAAACTLAIAVVLSACGSGAGSTASTQGPGEAPTTGQSTAAAPGTQVTITTSTGLELTFDVRSCMSPGYNVVNLQGSGAGGDLDLRASVQGRFTVTGTNAIEAEIDEVVVADDGSVAASGTLAIADAPDVRVPFELSASPGSCS
jgi:hypothetical protein